MSEDDSPPKCNWIKERPLSPPWVPLFFAQTRPTFFSAFRSAVHCLHGMFVHAITLGLGPAASLNLPFFGSCLTGRRGESAAYNRVGTVAAVAE